MKKLFLSFVLILTVSIAFATTKGEIVKIELKNVSASETTIANITFNTIQDFISFDLNQLNNFNQLNVNDIDCTVDITVTVSVGSGSTYVSATIVMKDVPCGQVVTRLRKLKDDIKGVLK